MIEHNSYLSTSYDIHGREGGIYDIKEGHLSRKQVNKRQLEASAKKLDQVIEQ